MGSFAFPFLQIFPITYVVARIFPPRLHPIGDQAPTAWLAVAQGALTYGSLSQGEPHCRSASPPPRLHLSISFRRWGPVFDPRRPSTAPPFQYYLGSQLGS